MKSHQRICALADILKALQTYEGTDTLAMPENTYPTQMELARLTGLDKEDLKKCLKRLNAWALVHPTGLNPKRYRFDEWQYRMLLEGQTDSIPDQDSDEFEQVLAVLKIT